MIDTGLWADFASNPGPVAKEPEGAPPSRIADTLAALANGEGGTLLLGLEAGTGASTGLTDPESALERALQAAQSTDPPLILPFPQLHDWEGVTVLAVDVPPGMPHVYGHKGRYLVRDGARNRPLTASQLRRLMLERVSASFEAAVPLGAGLGDLDWEKVERHLVRLGFGPPEPEAHLLRRGLIVRGEGDSRPTYAGLLLFGRDPQRWVPSGQILIARYAGSGPDDRFVKAEIQGTLPDQIRQAEAFVLGNVRRAVRLAGLERIEEPEFPPEVVREAIVNAVAHRDYQVRGDEIRILIFGDRLEVYSPGRLPGHVTLQNIVDERFSRNPAIVQVLSDMGFIERLGYGIDRMLRLMAASGLPAPRFEETTAGFKVTLPGQGTSLTAGQADARRWRRLGLNERQELAMAHLVEKGRITNRDFQELCPDVSPETIRRDLADLVGKDLLLKIGEKRATYYILK